MNLKNLSLRKKVQIITTLLQNSYFLPLLNPKIYLYKGPLKFLCGPSLNCYSCPFALFSCPLGLIQNFFFSLKFLPLSMVFKLFTYLFSFLLLWGVLIGRIVCGWICPIGFFQELTYKLSPFKKIQIFSSFSLKSRIFSKGLFFFFTLIFIPFGGGIFLKKLLPFCEILCPAGTLEASFLQILLHKELLHLLSFLFFIKLFFFIVFLFFTLAELRFFCKFLCPLGLVYGLFNKLSFELKVNPNFCTKCKACEKVCPMNIKVYEEFKHFSSMIECIKCFECQKVCPSKAIKFESPLTFIKAQPKNLHTKDVIS